MHRTKILECIIFCFLLLSCTKKGVQNNEENKNVIDETEIKEQVIPQYYIDKSNLEILDDYEINFGNEEYYRFHDGIVISYDDETKYRKNYNATFHINENGFLIFTLNNKDFIVINNDISETVVPNFENAGYVLNEKNLKALSSDGYFSEILNGKLIEYKIDGLRKSVMYGFEKGDNPMYTNPTPFVTKRGNSGIGEIIKLQTVSPIRSISILPGYVNTERQDLFYKNNRPKKIKIRDVNSDYGVIAELSDLAIFQKIEFTHQMENLEIEILEVYSGTKYDDTCISGILIESIKAKEKDGIQSFNSFIPKHNEDKSMGTEIRNGEICALRGSTESLDFDIQFPDCWDATKFWTLQETNTEAFLRYYDKIALSDSTNTFDNYYFNLKLTALNELKIPLDDIRKEVLNHPICVFGKYSNDSDTNKIFIISENEVEIGDYYILLSNPLVSLTNSYHYIFTGLITDVKEVDRKLKVYIDNSSVYIDFAI